MKVEPEFVQAAKAFENLNALAESCAFCELFFKEVEFTAFDWKVLQIHVYRSHKKQGLTMDNFEDLR